MLASTVFEDEEVLAVDRQIDVVKLPAGRLAERTVVDADVRSRTGCTVLAAVRGQGWRDDHGVRSGIVHVPGGR